jgi:hypothetical protein
VGGAAEDVQYERGAGARMANEGTIFNRAVKIGMHCGGFPALPASKHPDPHENHENANMDD